MTTTTQNIGMATAGVVVARALLATHEARQDFADLIKRFGGATGAHAYAEGYREAMENMNTAAEKEMDK